MENKCAKASKSGKKSDDRVDVQVISHIKDADVVTHLLVTCALVRTSFSITMKVCKYVR